MSERDFKGFFMDKASCCISCRVGKKRRLWWSVFLCDLFHLAISLIIPLIFIPLLICISMINLREGSMRLTLDSSLLVGSWPLCVRRKRTTQAVMVAPSSNMKETYALQPLARVFVGSPVEFPAIEDFSSKIILCHTSKPLLFFSLSFPFSSVVQALGQGIKTGILARSQIGYLCALGLCIHISRN